LPPGMRGSQRDRNDLWIHGLPHSKSSSLTGRQCAGNPRCWQRTGSDLYK